MVCCDGNLFAAHTTSPQLTGFAIRNATNRERQMQSQPLDCNFAILVLASAFAGFGGNLRWSMNDLDCGFHFVAVLPARSATPRTAKLAVLQQLVDRQRGWMGRVVIHGRFCMFARRRLYPLGAVSGSPLSFVSNSRRKGAAVTAQRSAFG